MKGINELFIVAWMLFGILLTPLFFIAFDFWAGIRKAKQRSEMITSDKWQRTVRKISRYYNMLFALVILDSMQIAGVWYLDNYYDYHVPIFPFVTLLGAIVVGAIEIKSIFEKADEKEKREYKQVAMLAAELSKLKTDPDDVVKAIAKYLSKEGQ